MSGWILCLLALAAIPAAAQVPAVHVDNVTRPGSADLQIGDRFEIVVRGGAKQPVSVRTSRRGRTDWGPVIGSTDELGRWSTSGQFEKADFGDWNEMWTVGGKLSNPVVHFFVGAPCIKGGREQTFVSGPNMVLSCDTAAGAQTFTTGSDAGLFRSPDGRIVPARGNMTAEEYHAEIMQYLITSHPADVRPRERGDEAGALILKIIGANALTADETRNVLAVIRSAFDLIVGIPPAQNEPSETLHLLRKLADSTIDNELKQRITETAAYVQTH
jgi:hypothetical protein